MAIQMPLFGVCYGHQLMAWALGGDVEYHPKGREAGTQTVTRLPEGASVLASSAHDNHQIVRYGPFAVSVQFHPEIATDLLRLNRANIEKEGIDANRLVAGVLPAPDAAEILRRFVQGVAGYSRARLSIHTAR
ncbi:Glutamine amidotransferase class-I [Kosakonia oryziphila]|uniref:Glutamine amidotransferase class-I n=1 Tax=Kosakonia oryziphila TaxID=1005667 RepID=A0A1C4CGL5_9ENTR|nr:Glutamine amidotransferase class-I [Kosakonia oryziphila]